MSGTDAGSRVQVVDIDDVPWVEREHVRSGVMRIKTLAVGEQSSRGNFALMLSHTPDGYDSPRHRHNFDQIRFQLEGDFDFTSDGVMKPGSIAYFPEGVRYGPQKDEGSSLTLVLQFGGASGDGYMSEEQYQEGTKALAERGTFEGGVYTRTTPDGGKVNKDAYEAVWEVMSGRPLVYPAPRYARAVFLEPEHFDWAPEPDQRGVARKALGEYSGRGTRMDLYQLEPGAALPLAERTLVFIVSGEGEADGASYRARTTVCVPEDAGAEMRAGTATELLRITLPRFN